jgi:GNAT superfamily N-acetyltransferase
MQDPIAHEDDGRLAIRMSEQAEIESHRDLFAAAPPALGLSIEQVAGATLLLAPALPVNLFNRVIGLGEAQPATEGDIDAIVARYAGLGVRDYWIHLGPTARPVALGDWLAARGFAPARRRTWAKFLRGVEPPPVVRTDTSIQTARAEHAEAVARIACTVYEMPPSLAPWFASLVTRPDWHFLIAWLDGTPVGIGALYVTGRLGWLGVGATLPEARGRGAQSALLAARIRLAAELGCEHVATETGEPVGGEKNPSLDNIRRSGFTQVCSRLNLAAPASPA